MKLFIPFIFLILLHFEIFAQIDTAEIDMYREEIRLSEMILNETDKTSPLSLELFNVVNQRVHTRGSLLRLLAIQIDYLDKQIDSATILVEKTKKTIALLENEYVKMIFSAYKNYHGNNIWIYLLAAESFYQAYQRLTYLSYFAEFRRSQIALIQKLKTDTQKKVLELEKKKQKKSEFFLRKLLQNQLYTVDELEREGFYEKIKEQRTEILKQIHEQAAENKELGKTIANSFIDAAEKIIKRVSDSIQDAEMDKRFEKFKHKFSYPVANAVIISEFGTHKHPLFSNIKIRNDGIDLAAPKGSEAKAIFDGYVSQVVFIAGTNYSVLLKHGNYYSLYSNLAESYVKQGDFVKTNQKLGLIFTDSQKKNNLTVLKFQIWKNLEKQNPVKWLKK